MDNSQLEREQWQRAIETAPLPFTPFLVPEKYWRLGRF